MKPKNIVDTSGFQKSHCLVLRFVKIVVYSSYRAILWILHYGPHGTQLPSTKIFWIFEIGAQQKGVYIYKYTFLQITFRWIYMYILYACMIIYVSFVWNLCFFLKNSHPKPTKLDLGRDRGHNFQGGDDEKWRKFAKNGFIFQWSNEQKKPGWLGIIGDDILPMVYRASNNL